MRALHAFAGFLTLIGVLATPNDASAFMEELYTTDKALAETLNTSRREAQRAGFDRSQQKSPEREKILTPSLWTFFVSDKPDEVALFNYELGHAIGLNKSFDLQDGYHLEVMMAKVDFLHIRDNLTHDHIQKIAEKIYHAMRAQNEKDANFWPPELHQLGPDDLPKTWVRHGTKMNKLISDILEPRGRLRVIMNRCATDAGRAKPEDHIVCSAAYSAYYAPKGPPGQKR